MEVCFGDGSGCTAGIGGQLEATYVGRWPDRSSLTYSAPPIGSKSSRLDPRAVLISAWQHVVMILKSMLASRHETNSCGCQASEVCFSTAVRHLPKQILNDIYAVNTSVDWTQSSVYNSHNDLLTSSTVPVPCTMYRKQYMLLGLFPY